MSPAKKTVLCIASFLPVALAICYVVCMLANMRSMMAQQLQMMQQMQSSNDPAAAFGYMRNMFGLMLAFMIPTIIVHLTLMVIYLILAVRNRVITETERVIWILAFVLFGSIAYPIYFFMRIYGVKDEPKAALQQL